MSFEELKLWDLRYTSRRDSVPLSSTPIPDSHLSTRHFGISSLALSGDGARLYALCKDATVYTYSTNHLMLGPTCSRSRRFVKEPKEACSPLYAFRHPQLSTPSFWIKLAIRPARGDNSELLAAGSGTGSALLFGSHLYK